MSIRVIPLQDTTTEPAEQLPELMTAEEVGKRLHKHPNTIRQWIALDMVDGAGRVPGGRVGQSGTAAIVRAVFERAMRDGIEPARRPITVAPDVTEAIAELREMAARCAAIADHLRDAQVMAVIAPGGLRKTG